MLQVGGSYCGNLVGQYRLEGAQRVFSGREGVSEGRNKPGLWLLEIGARAWGSGLLGG